MLFITRKGHAVLKLAAKDCKDETESWGEVSIFDTTYCTCVESAGWITQSTQIRPSKRGRLVAIIVSDIDN